tara:strand:- start:369 stop:746 length:378 start_codon:yes stop_codon:yes gene_type:complete
MKGLKHMADLMVAAPNSAGAKLQWLNAAREAARSIAKDLGLAPGTFDIRTCEGGIAVPGEVTLHGESLYLCLGTSMPGGELVGFARSCKGRKDYTGGVNRWLSTWMTFDKMVQVCREAMAARGEA